MPNAQGLKVVENLGDLENPGNLGNLEEQEDPEDKYLTLIIEIYIKFVSLNIHYFKFKYNNEYEILFLEMVNKRTLLQKC